MSSKIFHFVKKDKSKDQALNLKDIEDLPKKKAKTTTDKKAKK